MPLGYFPVGNTDPVDMRGTKYLAGSTRTRANPAGWSRPRIRLRRWDESRRDRTPPDGKTNVRSGDFGQS